MLSIGEGVQVPQACASKRTRPGPSERLPRAASWNSPSPRANRILAALPATTFQRIADDLKAISLSAGEALYEVGRNSRYAYFPTTAVISLVCDTAEGSSSEICTVGNDGVLGFALLLGSETTSSRAVVLRAGQAYRLDCQLLKRELALSGPLLQTLLRYTLAVITQTAQTAVCNRHHSLDQQLCRRLLLLLDRSPAREFPMTHETIAGLLGVRRESITMAAGKLQSAGFIKYFRGRIEILDRRGLEARACECYRVIRDATDDATEGEHTEADLAA